MSKTKPKSTTDELRRLLDFIDSYAAEHPEFAEQLAAALRAPTRAKAAPLRSPVEVYLQEGPAALEAYLAAQPLPDLVKVGKALGLRLTQKAGAQTATQRIMERVQTELNRGAVFSRETPAHEERLNRD